MDTSPTFSSGPETSGLAIWSLVLGILGLVLSVILIGPLFAIPAVICGHLAYSRIGRSGGTLTGGGLAIGGLITGYLSFAMIPFIGLLAAIAIPNFAKARDTAQQNACINNLRMIDGAKEQWALEHRKERYETPPGAQIAVYLSSGSVEALQCPKGGIYTINAVETKPTCSLPGHALIDY
jgi:competence protein ComGC